MYRILRLLADSLGDRGLAGSVWSPLSRDPRVTVWSRMVNHSYVPNLGECRTLYVSSTTFLNPALSTHPFHEGTVFMSFPNLLEASWTRLHQSDIVFPLSSVPSSKKGVVPMDCNSSHPPGRKCSKHRANSCPWSRMEPSSSRP
jgi:hypothetical protein